MDFLSCVPNMGGRWSRHTEDWQSTGLYGDQHDELTLLCAKGLARVTWE